MSLYYNIFFVGFQELCVRIRRKTKAAGDKPTPLILRSFIRLSYHQFADEVRELHGVLDAQTLDEQCLRIEQLRVLGELVLVGIV